MVENPIVIEFEVKQKRIGQFEGFIVIEARLIRNYILKIFEYYKNGVISIYRYHVMAEDNMVLVRWDNAPHHRELDNFPHHLHNRSDVEGCSQPNMVSVLYRIPNYW